MNYKTELIKNAIDANGFQLGGASQVSAGYINPDIWNRSLVDYQKQNLVITPLGMQYNDLLNAPGEVLNVSIDAEPLAASALIESNDVAIDQISFTQVQFTPTEYGAGYELSDKEARRSFFKLTENMTSKLSYRLALKKENLVTQIVTAGAGHSVVVNDATSGSLQSSDTLDVKSMIKAMTAIRRSKYTPKDLIVSVEQIGDLMNLDNFKQAYAFGGREVILGGKLGVILGLNVYWTQGITTDANHSQKAIMLGVSGTGEASFGIAQKSNPTIRTQYFARGRYTDIVAVEEYDIKVLHGNAIATIESYAA